MIVARLEKTDGMPSLLLLLEPGNIAKIQMGQPIIKNLKDFGFDQDVEIVLAYSPDVQYVADRAKDGASLMDAISESMTRKEVYVRPKDAEDMRRVL